MERPAMEFTGDHIVGGSSNQVTADTAIDLPRIGQPSSPQPIHKSVLEIIPTMEFPGNHIIGESNDLSDSRDHKCSTTLQPIVRAPTSKSAGWVVNGKSAQFDYGVSRLHLAMVGLANRAVNTRFRTNFGFA
ncbi:hypothetical protein R1flu_020357 [Riccia fluitans]|uniref:Uncharacterized protein n=1 Tax=Riccia fluitans TaxID=41844 RepID=A0ABD1ZL99_9MARC